MARGGRLRAAPHDLGARRARRAARCCSPAGAATSSRNISKPMPIGVPRAGRSPPSTGAARGARAGDIRLGNYATFDGLIDDLAALIADWRAATPTGPHVAIGHSMGGHLLLRTLVDKAPALDAAVLVAPMIRVNSYPMPAWLAPQIAEFMCLAGWRDETVWKLRPGPQPAGRRAQPQPHQLGRALCRRIVLVGGRAGDEHRPAELGLAARRLSLRGEDLHAGQAGHGRDAGADRRHRARPAGERRRDPRRGGGAAQRADRMGRTRPRTKSCARPTRSGSTRSAGSTPSSPGIGR